MRIITLNANGIRSASRKGLFRWLARQRADVLCVQETKARTCDLEGEPCFRPRGWHVTFRDAQKKGYAGVAIYSREKPDAIVSDLGHPEFDGEGRYLEFRFGSLSVVSLYLPSGSAGPHRQASKDRFLDFFLPQLSAWHATGRDYIVCGDLNIAHRDIDLRNFRANQKYSGFLPHERAWMERVTAEVGWVDGYRHLYPEATGESYTWWSNRGQAWAKNVGWRIDYQLCTPGVRERLLAATIYKKDRFSDHAPLSIDYRF